ncbi:MAG TPA: oligosaccharide flippase family protein [Polyangia bacterium]|nr:oligosaccharide flippase family protein [Polyangia bacterium]
MSSSQAPPASGAAAALDSQRAGRGFLFITTAKLYFMLAGAVIEFVLPHLFPADESARLFGLYKVTVGIVSVINNVMITVTIQSVSKFVAEDDAQQGQVARAGFRLMALIGIVTAGTFAAVAPLLSGFEHDAALTPYLRISAAVVVAYSIYSVFVGIANGRREFHKQAGLDMTFSTLRAAGVLGLAAAGLGVGGAVGGFAAAAVAIGFVAALVVRVPPRGGGPAFPAARLAGFFGQVGLYTLLLNLLLWVGLFLLKRYTPDQPKLPGYYAAAQTLSVLSYQAIIAVIFVIFPLISRATFEGDAERARAYVGHAMRNSLLLATLFGVTLAARPAELLRVPYPADFAAGAVCLRALGLGFVAFSMLAVAGAILNGAGKTGAALATVGGTLAVAVAANVAVVPGANDPLRAAAVATAGAMGFGLLLSALFLRRHFGSFVPLASLLRVVLAGAAGLAAGMLMPARGKLVTLLELAVVALVYVATLVITREIGRADLASVQRVMRGRS